MNAITYNAWNPRHLGYVIVFTALINGSLFAALPWLTHIVTSKPTDENVSQYIILPKTEPKPPEPDRNRRIIDPILQPPPKIWSQPKPRPNNAPDITFEWDDSNNNVSVILNNVEPDFPEPDDIIFDWDQLDKEPRIIRKVLPIYPHAAKSKGIRARVKIRCLVDKDGMPQKIEAAECDPEDALDIFGPPAVKAVQKWRFRPGEIGGDPVPTRVAFRVIFEID
jgi:protein TonB